MFIFFDLHTCTHLDVHFQRVASPGYCSNTFNPLLPSVYIITEERCETRVEACPQNQNKPAKVDFDDPYKIIGEKLPQGFIFHIFFESHID